MAKRATARKIAIFLFRNQFILVCCCLFRPRAFSKQSLCRCCSVAAFGFFLFLLLTLHDDRLGR